MSFLLTPVQARVLGSLTEKESTTPEYYPLSLNALVNACNQRSNRDPVMNLEEEEVRRALYELEQLGLAGPARGGGSRVTKFEHWLGEAFNFTRAEHALLCVLLLRGAQTAGELRVRTERMHRFEEIGDVTAALQKLIERNPPLAAILPREPGTKEARFIELLSAERHRASEARQEAEPPAVSNNETMLRISRIEQVLEEVQAELASLREKIETAFK